MNRAIPRTTLILAGLTLALSCQSDPVAPPDETEAQLDRLLSPLAEHGLISGTVLIARHGKVVTAKGYGLANREDFAPNTPETVFELASVSKSITAIAVMKLVEAGDLRLDTKLAAVFPDFPHASEITVEMLLTHTSGLPSYVYRPDFGRQQRLPMSPAEMRRWFAPASLDFEPGTRFRYSNTGYVLLAMMVEEISGLPYGEYLTTQVFGPAGMQHTGLNSYTQIIPHRAIGHSRDACSGAVTRAEFRDPLFDRGAGALVSTVGDLLRLHLALENGTVLGREALSKMQEPRLESSWGEDYGYGWFIGESHGRRIVHHEGGTAGFMTTFRRFVDDDIVVIALFNQDLIIANELFSRLDAIALARTWKPLFGLPDTRADSSKLTDFAGVYQMVPDGSLKMRREDDRLWIEEPGCRSFELWPMGPDRGFAAGANALLTFHTNERGEAEVRAQYGILRWDGRRVSSQDGPGGNDQTQGRGER